MASAFVHGLIASFFLFQVACASWVSKTLGLGEPVTRERCEAMKMHDFGFKDGSEARRSGERFESWVADCRAFGVKFDRAEYDQGYEAGLASYCSCENGFGAGVRDQWTEFRGQYFMCQRASYGLFLRGHEEGKKHVKDPELVNVISAIKVEYFDEKIAQKAVQVCANLPAAQATKTEDRLHIALKIDAQKKIAGPQVIAHLVFKNNTKQPLRIAKFVIGDGKEPSNAFFKVYNGKVKLDYRGMMAKRAAPTAADILTLKPGEELKGSFDLSSSYEWANGPATYAIHYETTGHIPNEELSLRSEEARFSF